MRDGYGWGKGGLCDGMGAGGWGLGEGGCVVRGDRGGQVDRLMGLMAAMPVKSAARKDWLDHVPAQNWALDKASPPSSPTYPPPHPPSTPTHPPSPTYPHPPPTTTRHAPLRLTPRAPRGSRASRPPFVRSGGPCGLAWALCACARASACAFVRND